MICEVQRKLCGSSRRTRLHVLNSCQFQIACQIVMVEVDHSCSSFGLVFAEMTGAGPGIDLDFADLDQYSKSH